PYSVTIGVASTREASPAGLFLVCSQPEGSRTRPGLHAVAREYAGLFLVLATPELADSPWATRCRPRVRGLIPRARNPRARGLALGYTLSPASTRAYSST